MALLEVHNLKKHFPIQKGLFKKTVGYVEALTDISFSINEGTVLGVIGESGSGKSTLAKVILCLTKPTAGTVYFDGVDLFSLSVEAMKHMRKKIQVVFQNPAQSLNPKKTIGDTLSETLLFHNMVAVSLLRERLETLLERVGLERGHVDRYPHELSLGQQQRVCIARAISIEPRFIILDECVSALDVSVQSQILHLLVELKEKMNITYLFISHDLTVVENIADQVIVMRKGKILEHGVCAEVFLDPKDPYTKKLIDSKLARNPRESTIRMVGSE